MAFTGTSLLSLPIITTGTESGAWGNITNNGLTQYLDTAIAGALSITSSITLANTSGDASGTNLTSTTAQYRTLVVPASGPSANIVITAPSSNRTYHVINRNATYTVQIRAGANSGVTLAANQSATVSYDSVAGDYVLVGPNVVSANKITLSGTNNTTMTLPSTDATIARTDAGQTFTGTQVMTSPRIVTSINDTNGNEVFGITATASAVNEVTVTNAATGNSPTLSASGGDTNVALTLAGKGTGDVVAQVNSTNVFSVSSTFGFKNRIINGGMGIAQRGTSFTSTGGANNDDTYNLDRFYLLSDGNDVVDITQTTTVPTGAKYSIGLDVETINKKFGIAQIIENGNCFDAIGQTVTLSFDAKVSSTTKLDNVKCAIIAWSGTADSVTSDIISAWGVEGTNPTLIANATYENSPTNLNVTTSFARYTVSAAVDTSNTTNIIVFIWSDVTDTTLGDFLYITNVQLEKGSTATSFDFRSYGTELALCQRYFYKNATYSLRVGAYSSAPNNFISPQAFPVTMRATPTVTNGSVNYILNTAVGNAITATTEYISWNVNVSGGTGADTQVSWTDYQFSSEL